jgi:hypothetical protein
LLDEPRVGKLDQDCRNAMAMGRAKRGLQRINQVEVFDMLDTQYTQRRPIQNISGWCGVVRLKHWRTKIRR